MEHQSLLTTNYLDELWKILTFFGIQYALGRRGSFPYGLVVKFSLLKITLLVILSDVIQTLVLLNFFGYLSEKIPWLKRKKKKPKKSWWEKIKKHGEWGLVFIAALPYGGGALTGSIAAVSMKLEKKRAFLFIIIGCIIGSIIFYLGFTGILAVI